MDAERFDRIARLLPAASRRGAVRMLGALAVGGSALALLSPDEAAAKCVNPGKRCKKKGEAKKACCGGASCKGKRCKCPVNRVKCGAKCCAVGQICANGVCTIACPQGSAVCLNTCCVPGQTCVNNVCTNGAKAVGAQCPKDFPGLCSSGKCGCNSNDPNLCACREANCKAPTAACAGSLECCQGVCIGGFCSGS